MELVKSGHRIKDRNTQRWESHLIGNYISIINRPETEDKSGSDSLAGIGSTEIIAYLGGEIGWYRNHRA